jgi:DUF971 family protein
MSEAPTSIRALQSDRILELSWEDGTTARLPYHYLRGECPCASCRDEWTGERMVQPESLRPDLQLERMEGVGNYAVQFAWNDGHGSGLFTWELLRKLSHDCPLSSLGTGPKVGPCGDPAP